jgi:hypothetical protein
MKKSLLLASALVAFAAAGPVRADDDDCDVPMSKWQTRDAVRAMAEAQGWNVRRVKIDDGCYEIKGYDASGREIEAKIDPATLAVIDMEYEDDDDDDDDGGNRRSYNNGSGTTNVTPTAPPNNGLFAPGSKPQVILK